MNSKLIPTLLAAGLLAVGIGVSGALAGDDHPAPAPVACSILAPGGDENDAAEAVENAADNVSEEADRQEADDQQGDEAEGNDNDQGEQGDCDDQGEDEQVDD
jgi:hypothetical protein